MYFLKSRIVIQRIQTLYLLGAILCTIGLYFTSQDVEILGFRIVEKTTIVSAIHLIVSIFLFKKRPLQIMFAITNIIINALLIGLLGYWLLNLSGGIDFPEKGIEPIFSLIAIVFLLLASKNIAKDERLVKSVDRLR